MRKLHLILLSLVAALPGGYLCYLMGGALATPNSDLWKKPILGGTVVATGLLVLVVVVWPLLYAIAFYDDPNKRNESEEAAGEDSPGVDAGVADRPKTPRAEGFEEEDIDVFEREGVEPGGDDADEFAEVSEDAGLEAEEESFESAETSDFDLNDADFEDLELDDEEEEAPKKKAKKNKKKKK